jgi:hypothetical protein
VFAGGRTACWDALTELRERRQCLVDSERGPLYALWVRWLVLGGFLWLFSAVDPSQGRAQAPAQPAVGTCLGGTCQVGAPVTSRASGYDLSRRRAPPTRGFATGAAWFGVLSGALSLGGSIAIASLDDHAHETLMRGVWVGYTALALPIVAIGSYTTRKRARVEGVRGLRTVGWTAYMGALGNGIAQWYLVFMDARPSTGFTVGVGALSLMAFLPHAFDAYISGRAARAKGLARLSPGVNGLLVRF